MVLKDKQSEAIKRIYKGNDRLPTGYGKSLCYQLILCWATEAIATERSIALVISSLGSLMVIRFVAFRLVAFVLQYLVEMLE